MSSQVATGTLAPAAIGQRAIAYLIDAIILSILYTLLVSFAAVASLLRGDTGLTDSLLRAVLFAVASFVYFAYTWRAMRASPGQRVLGLTTVNAADGAPLSWNQASLRWAYLYGPASVATLFSNAMQAGGFLSAIVGVAVFAYYIYLLRTTASDPRRQGFHDKQASSLVLKPAS